ncbi:MAG TPA: rhomboid family intramembrane serine protease, partial [Solirubrobacteraceae bacterium]|nr:rhomboid family intramembrane serine protease [Solirubrobacteraceae bacterium]
MIPIKDNIPTGQFPFVTVALIAINFIVYVLAIRHGGSFISGPSPLEEFKYGAIPDALTHPGVHCAEVVRQTLSGTGAPEILCNTAQLNASHIAAENPLPVWETVFTAMFMHASIIHIGGNMLFLWIFGDNVEAAMGRVKYLLFYLAGGLAAIALQVAVSPDSTAPTLGASGAIAAVLGAYIVLYPRARVLTLVFIIFIFTVIELPAWVMLGVWFAEQAVFGAAGLTDPTGGGSGVAYFAHVGGFVFGLLAVRVLAKRARQPPP